MSLSTNISLSGQYSVTIKFIEKFTSGKYWRMKLVLLLTLISLFLSPGAYYYLPTAMTQENWVAFDKKKEHPFSQQEFKANSHAAKKTFRLTIPVLAKIFHLGNYLIFLLQFLCNILFLFFSIILIEKIINDKVLGLLAATGFVFIYAGHAGFTDIYTWFDGFAFLFLLLAMLKRNPYWIFFWLFLACWTDERAVISSGLIFLYWKLTEENSRLNFKSLFKLRKSSISVVITLGAYFITRFALSSLANLHTPMNNVGMRTILKDINFEGLAIWTFLEGFWILILIAIIVLWKQKNNLLIFLILSFISLITLVAFSVFDKTRSGAYLFPLIFISVLILKETFSLGDIRKIFLIAAIVCFLFPSYYIISDSQPYVLWYKPIPLKIIDFIRDRVYGIY